MTWGFSDMRVEYRLDPKGYSDEDRTYYLDLLRVVSVFFVLVIHVVSTNGLNTPVESFHWKALFFYWSLSEFSVPVLFMISGALFLDPARDIRLEKLWKRNILRIVVAFLFWSALYAPVKVWKDFHCFDTGELLRCFFEGYVHLWFLYALIPLYVVVPFLRVIVKDEVLLKYFLLLTFVFSVLLPDLQKVPALETTKWITGNLNMDMALFSRFSFYFVLGHYIHRKVFSKRERRWIYLLGIAGALFAVLETYGYRGSLGGYGVYLTVHCVFQSCAIFLFAKEMRVASAFSRAHQWVTMMAKLSFGVYLVHMFVNGFFFHVLKWTTLCCNPFLSVPGLAVLVFGISACISYFLRKVPILGKYVV